jgi:hypothetical protein
MIPVRNSYMLSEHLPNAILLTYPDSGRIVVSVSQVIRPTSLAVSGLRSKQLGPKGALFLTFQRFLNIRKRS